jgi:hypothetical protein
MTSKTDKFVKIFLVNGGTTEIQMDVIKLDLLEDKIKKNIAVRFLGPNSVMQFLALNLVPRSLTGILFLNTLYTRHLAQPSYE